MVEAGSLRSTLLADTRLADTAADMTPDRYTVPADLAVKARRKG